MEALPETAATDLPGGTTLQRMAGADRYNAWLLERAIPHLGRRVLDAGAGIGTFTEHVARGREVVAVEPDGAAAALLRRRFAGRPEVSVVEADATELDSVVLGTFDSVLCLNVLEHIADDAAALARFGTLLRRGGAVLLLVPAHPLLFGEIDRVVGHERRYTKTRLSAVLRSAGLQVEELRHVNPVGAVGWFAAARVLRRAEVPGGPLRLYDHLVPAFRLLDALRLPFGLSLWAVARA